MTDLVILVGGRGKRLGKITNSIPKPLIKINNKSFLDILLSKVITYNFKNIYLLCSYKKNLFFKKYHKKKIHNSKIFCIDEGYQKDTGGALFKIKKKIKKNFFLINGDSYFDFDYNKLIKLTNKKDIIGSIGITKNIFYKKNNKINNIKINKTGTIQYSKKNTHYMNGGVYFFKTKIFKYIQNKRLSLENDIINQLIKKKIIKGFYSNNKFIDIGSINKLNYIKKNYEFLKQKACFLDRDGVINKLLENDYVKKIDDLKFLPGIFKSIKLLNKLNYRVIVVTNQACVGKSIITEKKLIDIHNYMKEKIHQKKGYIDDIFYATYYKNSKFKKYRTNLNDRKPNSGMLTKAIDKWNIDVSKSFFIGDSLTDKMAAKKIEIKFYYKDEGSLYKQISRILNK